LSPTSFIGWRKLGIFLYSLESTSWKNVGSLRHRRCLFSAMRTSDLTLLDIYWLTRAFVTSVNKFILLKLRYFIWLTFCCLSERCCQCSFFQCVLPTLFCTVV
jgi:hypothetical protein